MARRQRRPQRWWPHALVVWVVLLVLASGCQIGPDDEPGAPGADAAELLVTAEHGAEELTRLAVDPGRSVLRTLQNETSVGTQFGGGFVSELFDRSSDQDADRDWFYFVDGVLGATGARQHIVGPNESIWWDYRVWSTVRDPWLVVGAWPAPFAGHEVAADPPFLSSVIGDGTRTVESSAWRIRVGAGEQLERREVAWRRAVNDPEGAGLTAILSGGEVRALSRSGRDYVSVPRGAALAAALPTGPDHTAGALMVVAGVTPAAADAAARRIVNEPRVLRDRYAVVFDAAGEPIFAAGQGPQ